MYALKKGSGKFGYEGVTAPHGPEKGYYARPPKELTNGTQQFIPGGACKTPAEAALRRAKFMVAPFEIVKQDPERAAKGEKKRSIEHTFAEPFAGGSAADEDLEDMPPWVVSLDAFKLWKRGIEPPASAQLSAAAAAEVWRLRAWASSACAKADTPAVPAAPPRKPKAPTAVPKRLSAAAGPKETADEMRVQRMQCVLDAGSPPPGFDPAVLERVAAIKRGAAPAGMRGL